MMKKYIITFIIAAMCIVYCVPGSAITAEYRIQPMDIIMITVHEQPDLDTRIRVSSDGYITFPLLGQIFVQGLTVQGLERRIKKLLEADYLVNAQVIVFIEEYHPRQVSVIGEVNNPGIFDMPAERDLTLLEAMAMAGGFTKDAAIDKTLIIRIKDGNRITIPVRVSELTKKDGEAADITLQPDDIVVISESFF